ncbi:Proteasome A-type subunit [Ostreococcus tauri]|uniref:Proteasome subunit alpha type n=1 Tax=Ostreococcus tauri TaxID=70448 RepID=A0A090M785_OSTTA|nr:Proteasome A-type subunit [Ostreococcus tauri]CEG00903.1 Proteasome A-type subunit [Ostreococcus tauri]|eukprot:XP_022840659.1 Proteasome A-type subunit [Ostreococcus tauri]
MARRYDSRTTTFSPEGRLFQVEYALESVNHAGTCVGLRTNTGVLLASEKKTMSKLLEQSSTPEKLWKIDKHIVIAVAGLNADAMILVNFARLVAGQYKARYGLPIPVENLVQELGDHMQGYTQFGGLRPYGVAFLFAGWQGGFQLYQSEPSGNFSAWKAAAIGASHQAARSILKTEYSEGLDISEAKGIVSKVLQKTMDCMSLTEDKVEMVYLSYNELNGEVELERILL